MNMDIINHFHYFIVICEDLDLQYITPGYGVHSNYIYIRQKNAKINLYPPVLSGTVNELHHETIKLTGQSRGLDAAFVILLQFMPDLLRLSFRINCCCLQG